MGVVTAVEWKAVESSLFISAAYRPGARQLYLRFREGKMYRYFDVPVQVYEAFLSAESKGRYFAGYIRNVFRYEQVGHAHRRVGRSLAGVDRTERISAGPLPTHPA
jgi:hypothetical protein